MFVADYRMLCHIIVMACQKIVKNTYHKYLDPELMYDQPKDVPLQLQYIKQRKAANV